MDDEDERLRRAEARRQRAWIRRTRLGDDADIDAISGAEAVALAFQLSEESWATSGRPLPSYTRATIPCRFIPGRRA